MKEKLLGDQVEIVKELMKELKKLPKPTPENQKKLDDKYRLEWNFHSNHIEGNTLTYGQTELLLFRGKATGDHEKQDYDEMEAHDLAIEMIKEWAKDSDRDITEADLRELNNIILVRPFWKQAITPDGQATRKKIIPGVYKNTPNSVRLKSGQIHDYSSPEEVPALMQKLMNWYQTKTKDLEPLLKAVFSHHEFTQIHPFDDGNGRVARLWANFILMREGYPPLIVRTENKEKYLTALQQADGDKMEPLVYFLGEELQWSIELSIKAAKGEPIDEPGDLDKKIALLKKELESDPSEEIKLQRHNVNLNELFINEIYPLIKKLYDTLVKFETFFISKECKIIFKKNNGQNEAPFEKWKFPSAFNEINLGEVSEIFLSLRLSGFKKAGTKSFDVTNELWFKLDKYGYQAHYINQQDKLLLDNLYSQNVEDDEINKIAKDYGDWVLKEINRMRKNQR